jgi:hypothetical protein
MGMPLYVLAGHFTRELPTRHEQQGSLVKANVWTGERLAHWIEGACGVGFPRAVLIGELLRRQLFIVAATGSVEQRFLGLEELWRKGPGKKNVKGAQVNKLEVVHVGSVEPPSSDFVIVSPRRQESDGLKKSVSELFIPVPEKTFIAAAPLIAKNVVDSNLAHSLSRVTMGAYKALSTHEELWKTLWHKHHTVVVPALRNRSGLDTVLLLKDQEISAKIDEVQAKAAMLGWSKYKYLFVYLRWIRLKGTSDITEMTKYFQQFKKLVSGFGNQTDVEACYKMRIEGYARLSPLLQPWMTALLTDFLVWKPANEAAYLNEMFIFDATEKRADYKLNPSIKAVTPPTLDALFKKTLGIDRKTKPTKEEQSQFLNSRDPAQTYIALKIALQQSLAPIEEIEYVIEFKRPFFPRGHINWSFLLVAKEWALIFNLSTRSDT